jgi:predicted peptidase
MTGLSVSREGNMEYGLYTPEEAGKGARYPLVLFLHGYTVKPLSEIPWQVGEAQKVEACYFLLPTVPEADGASAWGGTYDPDYRASMRTVLGLLDRVVAENPVDKARVYVYGESMGAEGAELLVSREPGRFAGAVAVAGAGPARDAPAMARTPLWLFHGSADTVNPVDSSRSFHAAIGAAGGDKSRYTEYPGADHGTIWDLVRREPGVLEWLLRQRIK